MATIVTFLGGMAAAVLIGVVGQAVITYTPLFRSHLVVQIKNTPKLEIVEGIKAADGTRRVLSKAFIDVKNSGIKPGYISRTEITANSLKLVPKAEVISITQRSIGPLRTQEVEMLIRIDHPGTDSKKPAEFKLDLFDEEDRYIGGIQWQGAVGGYWPDEWK